MNTSNNIKSSCNVLLCVSIFLISFNSPAIENNDTLAISKEMSLKSSVVVKAQIIDLGEGSKYRWAKIKVLSIIKNTTGNLIGNTIDAAYLSSEDPKLLTGDFIAYLVPYNINGKNDNLKFLEGSIQVGTTQ